MWQQTTWMFVARQPEKKLSLPMLQKIPRLFWKPETGNRKPTPCSKPSACSDGISPTFTCPPPNFYRQEKIRKVSGKKAGNHRAKLTLTPKMPLKFKKISKAKKFLRNTAV